MEDGVVRRTWDTVRAEAQDKEKSHRELEPPSMKIRSVMSDEEEGVGGLKEGFGTPDYLSLA